MGFFVNTVDKYINFMNSHYEFMGDNDNHLRNNFSREFINLEYHELNSSAIAAYAKKIIFYFTERQRVELFSLGWYIRGYDLDYVDIKKLTIVD